MIPVKAGEASSKYREASMAERCQCQYFDTFIDPTVNYLTLKVGTVFAEMRNHAKSVETVKTCEVVLHR